ncbi:MAG: hypothetical protein ACRBCT_02260 [Alphaproteobacteria bacterium]
MPEITLYHGSPTYFERPDPAFAGEGMAHSEFGWGFNMGTDGSTSAEYGGAHTDGVMFSYRVDDEWIQQSMIISDQEIGVEKYQKILEALEQIPNGDQYASQISPSSTGGDIAKALYSTELDIHRKAGAEKLAEFGIKGFWSKSNSSVVFFDFDDIPDSRIHQIKGDFPDAKAAYELQRIGDLQRGVANKSPEFQKAFQEFLDKTGTDLEAATSFSDIPYSSSLSNAFDPEYPSRSYLESAIRGIRDPEIRELFAEMHNAFAPDKPPITVTSVPEDEVDSLTLRQRVEYQYYNDSTGLREDTLKAVYATGDENLIQAVEEYAATLEKDTDFYTVNRVSNNLDSALGVSFNSQPDTPDKMGEQMGAIFGSDPQTEQLLDNMREALITYGERSLGIPSEARLEAQRAEALANARNNPAELIDQGNYMSSEFRYAAWSVTDTGNEALQSSFKDFASVLLSDEYNRRGLSEFESHGQHIDNGFTLRDGMGHAISRMINDGGLDGDHFGGQKTWIRQKEYLLRTAGDDPELVTKLEALEDTLFEHIEQVHGHKPNIPDVPNPHVKVASEAAQEAVAAASTVAKAARGGSHIPVIGAAIGLGGAVLSNQAHAGQREYIEQLYSEGAFGDPQSDVSIEALQEYNRINDKYDKLFMADAGAGSAAEFVPLIGQLAAAAGSISIEVGARSEFREWADKYAPNLNEEQFQTLAMSIMPGQSSRTDMLLDSASSLPADKGDQPTIFHDVIDARNVFFLSRAEMTNENARLSGFAGMRASPEEKANLERLNETHDAAQADLIDKMEALLSDPENVAVFLDQMPISERLEYARRLAASDNDLEALEANHPEIAAYTQAYDESWTGIGALMAEDDPLKENPDLLNAYIMKRNGVGMPEPQPNELLIAENFGASDAKYAGDTSILEEFRNEDGANLHPAALVSLENGPQEAAASHILHNSL